MRYSQLINSLLGNLVLNIWEKCLQRLKQELASNESEQSYNTWLRPLQAESLAEDSLTLYAPNQFVLEWIKEKYMARIHEQLKHLMIEEQKTCDFKILLKIGEKQKPSSGIVNIEAVNNFVRTSPERKIQINDIKHEHNINPTFTFESFVEGKSNQLARAAALQVAQNPGKAYNPMFVYGGVGLGKTHLCHAVGNLIMQENALSKVVYLHSERFVADMVKALQTNRINDFKHYYRSVNVLIIDDIQFFAGKDRSQEEFFHTFNALLEGGQQIILTSDRFPKEIRGVEERLQSRLGWGLTVSIEPPELETRVAILMSKAEQINIELPNDVAFFIAKRVRSNVRELEGALKRVSAHAYFTGKPISLELVKESLKDLLSLQDKLVSIDNIIKTVAEYYKIKVVDILSKRRSRSVARPRQIAMSLAKELTSHSLPEIGDAFGGRDHTTVIHAHRKILELKKDDNDIAEDFTNLLRLLTS